MRKIFILLILIQISCKEKATPVTEINIKKDTAQKLFLAFYPDMNQDFFYHKIDSLNKINTLENDIFYLKLNSEKTGFNISINNKSVELKMLDSTKRVVMETYPFETVNGFKKKAIEIILSIKNNHKEDLIKDNFEHNEEFYKALNLYFDTKDYNFEIIKSKRKTIIIRYNIKGNGFYDNTKIVDMWDGIIDEKKTKKKEKGIYIVEVNNNLTDYNYGPLLDKNSPQNNIFNISENKPFIKADLFINYFYPEDFEEIEENLYKQIKIEQKQTIVKSKEKLKKNEKLIDNKNKI